MECLADELGRQQEFDPAIRPSSTRSDSSQRSEDDLTTELLEIVKFNRELNELDLRAGL